MVRKKETTASSKEAPKVRNVKVAAKAPVKEPVKKPVKAAVAEQGETTEPVRKPVRLRRNSIAKKTAWAFVLVIALLTLGWFAARAAIDGSTGNSGFLSGLFDFNGQKLIGEEDGRVNILLTGNPGSTTHDGPDLTDTVMVASYNTVDKKMNLFSLPRDLQVRVNGYGLAKVNSVYSIGKNQNKSEEEGGKLLAEAAGDVLGLEVPYYMRIDFAGFVQLVDELGGIQVEVKKDLYDPFYPDNNKGYQLLDIKAGTYTMDGEMALKYVRSRQTTSDFDRSRRQQEVLLALRQKAMDLDLLTTPSKLFAVSSILEEHFDTNLSEGEMERLVSMLAEFDPNNIANKVFDDTPEGLLYPDKVDGAFVLKPVGDNYDKIHQFVRGAFANPDAVEPTSDEPVAAPLKIEVLNGTNTTGLAGKIAEQLKAAGFEIVRVANNPTRGIQDSIVYDNTDGKRFSAVKQLSEIVRGSVSTEKITLPAGVDARLVVGANTPLPQ